MFGYRREEFARPESGGTVPAKYRSDTSETEGFQQHPHTRPMGMGLDLNGLRKGWYGISVEISLSR